MRLRILIAAILLSGHLAQSQQPLKDRDADRLVGLL